MSYVYFIREQVEGGFIKIGKTGDPDFRLNALQTSNARQLLIEGIARGSGITERYLHEVFRSAYVHREWFNPVPELLSYMRKFPSWEQVKSGTEAPTLTAGEDEIVSLYDQGWTMQDIGNRWGVSRQAIQQMMAKLGKPRRTRQEVVSRPKSPSEVNCLLAF